MIEKLRRLAMPPCPECRHCLVKSDGLTGYKRILCANPRGLDRKERLSGEARRGGLICARVRGTAYCNFERREGGDDGE